MKKLYRVEKGKMICGVCGGIAEYFNIDPFLVRVIAIIGILCTGFGFGIGGILAYVIIACILPRKDGEAQEVQAEKPNEPEKQE